MARSAFVSSVASRSRSSVWRRGWRPRSASAARKTRSGWRKPTGSAHAPTPRSGHVGATWTRGALLFWPLALAVTAGAAPFAFDGSSASLGWHANGTLRAPAALPVEGDGYLVPAP